MRVERLSNGLRLALKENRAKNIIALCGYVNGGSRTEGDSIKGLSHYYEHIIFRGGTALQAELETRKAFQALGEYGGYTADDATCYYFTVPKENFSEALWRYCDALLNLELTEEKIEKDRQSVIQEFHMSVSDRPWGLAYHNYRMAAYNGHPYKTDPLGFESVIRSAQFDAFRTFYEERYVPNQIALAVVGDFDSDRMIDDIESAFGRYDRGLDSFEIGAKRPLNGAMNEVGAHLNTESAYFYLGFHLPAAQSGDVPAMNVLARILGSARAARLEVALKQREQVAQNVLGFTELRKAGSMFTISVDLKPDNRSRAVELIAQELSKVIDAPVSEDELERAKRLMENNHYSHFESFQNQAQALCWHSIIGDAYETESRLSAIRAVTVEDIQRVAAKYLRWDNAVLSTVSPANASIEDCGEILRERLSRPNPKSVRSGSDEIAEFTLDCGARVLFKRESGTGRFSALALIGGGQTIESPEEAGISRFAAKSCLRGTECGSMEEMQQEMADLGMEVYPSGGEDYAEFSLSCAARVRKDALRLFCEILGKPSFPSSEIELMKSETAADIASIKDESFTHADLEFRKIIYGSHPYGRSMLGDEESIKRLSIDRLRAFHSLVYRGPNILLSAAGDADVAEIERDLNELTAQWSREKPPELPLIEPNASHPSGMHLIEKDFEQIAFNWGKQALSILDEDALALQIAAVFIGYRLFYRQVYDEGIAYRMWTLFPMRRFRAPFYFQMGVAPENFERARDGIAREVEKMLAEPFPQAEFESAKATLIQRFYLSQNTSATLADSMARYAFYGFDTAFLKNYSDRIRAISRSAVETAARKYIKFEDMALAAVGKIK